jgi:hypothetical protein
MLDLEEFLILRDLFNQELEHQRGRQKNRTQLWNDRDVPSLSGSAYNPKEAT